MDEELEARTLQLKRWKSMSNCENIRLGTKVECTPILFSTIIAIVD